MTAYERVLAARQTLRPTAMTYIERLFTDFVELRGDRRYGDDRAIVAGVARLGETPVTVIGIEKGRTIEERVSRNFGSAHPEGYRKAIRQMRLAEKFGRPVFLLVDTSGAFCGIGAEERGQGQAIAESMTTLMGLEVPVVSLVIGEGGSGGALALAVADEVWMLENAVYSVISPEGAASILWKDAARVQEASECLKLTAEDLLEMGVSDRIVREDGFSDAFYEALQASLRAAFTGYEALDRQALLDGRYRRFRKIGGIVS